MSAALAELCICDKHMIEDINEGTCLWCGHGEARPVREHAYRMNMERNHAPWTFERVVSPLSAARSHTWDQDACAMAALAWEKQNGKFPSSNEWSKPLDYGEHRPAYNTVLARFGGWQAFREYCAQIPRESIA